jgi:hypothetical protein
VCIGSPCVARAVNPGTTSAPTLESTRPASYVGTMLRPAGSTAVLGTYFGEYSAARDPRIVQLGGKLYF